MINLLAFLFLLVGAANSFGTSLEISADTKTLSNDPFSSYQWYLKTQDQVEYLNKVGDDLSSTKLVAVPGFDLGIEPNVDYDALMKRDTVVAILDTGANTTHEDLEGAFALNLAECSEGKTPAFAREDRDGNGYKADCLGWDFTQNSNRVEDMDGHGTHLSGIIAARKDNKKGIRGISNRVKILPLTVMGLSRMSLSDRLIKAFQYAISRKVDVINLSMGWPISEDKPELREVFRDAISRGIVVVAAAGNDGTREPVFPCAYEGVVCVGASDLSGRLSSDSNFGSQVDFLAPGVQILSTIPKSVASTFFVSNGYDVFDGSSQSAAEISGLFGVLKGIFPEESSAMLYSRLAQSSRVNLGANEQRGFLHGIPSLDHAIRVKDAALVQPILKDESVLNFSAGSPNINFSLRLKNFGAAAVETTIRVRSLSESVSGDVTLKLASLASGQEISYPLEFLLKDRFADNQVNLEFTVSNELSSTTYFHRFTLVRRLQSDDIDFRYKIQGGNPEVLAAIRAGKIDSNFTAIADPKFVMEAPSFFYTKKNTDGLDFYLVRMVQGQMRTFGPLSIPSISKIIEAHWIDINIDGTPDLFLFAESEAKEKGNTAREFLFLSNELKPIFSEKKSRWHLEYNPDTEGAPIPNIFSYIPAKMEGFGTVALPSQVLPGTVLPKDNGSSSFTEDAVEGAVHFYYFQPVVQKSGEVLVEKRIVDTKEFRNYLRSSLKLSWREDIKPLVSSGSPASLLLSVTKNSNESVFQIDASSLENWLNLKAIKRKNIPSLNYSWSKLNLSDAKRVGTDKVQNAFALGLGQQLDSQKLRWGIWKPELVDGRAYSVSLSDDNDLLQKISSVYFLADGSLRLYLLSANKLLEQTISTGNSKLRELPISRFSFIPGELMNFLYHPFYSGADGGSQPAIFIDKTAMNQGYMYVIQTGGVKLVAPAYYTLEVPVSCKVLNPGYSGANHQSTLMMLCPTGNDWELREVAVKIQ